MTITQRLRRCSTICAITIAFIGLLAGDALATHLRGVTLSWSPTGAPGEVTFTFKYSQRWTYPNSPPSCNAFSGFTPCPALNTTVSVPFTFGDGSTGTATGPVTSINQAEDWFTADLTVTHTYSGNGPYTAFYELCCRISSLKYGGDQTMRMETLVTPFSGNHSPVSSMPAIITVLLAPTASFALAAADLDRDPLTYRMATKTEMYGSSPPAGLGQPPGLTISATGQASWQTSAIAAAGFPAPVNGDLWTAQFMIEDRDASNNVKSKVPVDVILKFVTQIGNLPTLLIAPAGPLSVQVNTPISFTVTGNDVDANARVILNATGMPQGATVTNLNQLIAPPVTSMFSWTPTAAQVGSYVVSFSATDDTLQQTLRSITIFVENNVAPTISGPTTLSTPYAPQAPISVQVADFNGDPLTVTWELDGVIVRTDSVPAAQGTTTLTFAGYGNVGLHSVTATVTDSKNASTSLTTAVTVTKASQTLVFGPFADQAVGGSLTLSATASSGLPLTFSVVSGPAAIPPSPGNVVTFTATGPVTLRASQGGDANYNPAAVDRTLNVVDLDVTSITFETRQWNGHRPTSTADAINTYLGLPIGVPGYAPGAKTLLEFKNVSNQAMFNGTNGNLGYHHHFAFEAPIAGTLAIRMGADFGGGGTLIIDGVELQFRSTDMWWNGSFSNPTQYLFGTVTITPGLHTIDSYGFEGCCDGKQQAEYSYLNAPYKIFTAPANDVPVAAITGPPVVDAGTTNVFTFTVLDQDAGATFTLTTASCGVNGTVIGAPSVTSTGGSFACAFVAGPSPSAVSVQVTDNRGAQSSVASFSVKLSQAITFDPLANVTFGAPDFTVSALASSGLPVSFSASGACSVTGNTVHVLGGGTCTITASQSGDARFAAAPPVPRAFTIGKADATVTVAGYTTVYDGNPHGATGTATGLQSEDLSGLLHLGASFTNVPGGTASWTFDGNANYNAASGTAAIVITKATPTVQVVGATFPYDATPHPATGSVTGVGGVGLGTPTFTYNAVAAAPVNAGTYAVIGSFAGDANYTAATGTATIVITKVNATVNVAGYTGVYDGNPHGATGSATGVTTENLASLLHLGASFTNVPGGTASWTFDGDGNYNATNGTAAIVITKANATVNVAGYTGVYDGNPHGATGSATGVTTENLASLLHLGASFTNVPGGTASWTFDGNANYNAANGTAAIVITKATPTVQVADATFPYDATSHPATGSVTGIGGVGLGTLTFTYDAAAAAPVNAGTYAVIGSFAGDGNYTAATGTATIVITKATPTVQVADATFPYDATSHPATGSVTGVGGVGLGALTFTYNAVAAAPVNAGTYAVIGSFSGDANYTAATGTATIVITKANATVTVAGYTGVYDGNPHGATGSATGVTSENLASLLHLGASFTNVPGGTASWTFDGDGNYNATSGTAPIVITKANATVTVTGYTGVYDGNPHGATGSATGLNGLVLTGLLNLGQSFTNVPGGTASWTFAGNGNYNAASGDAPIAIAKGAVSVTADNKTKIVGAALPPFTASYSGFVGTDGVTSLGGTLQFATTATVSSPVGSYPITPSGLTSGNYTLTFVPGTLHVTYNVCIGYDDTKLHNSGSTIPIKLQLCGASGLLAGSAAIVVHATELVRVSTQASGIVEDAGQANPDDDFRLTGSAYMFNLQTKGLTTGTYKLVFTVTGDPESHSVTFKIR